MNMTVFQEVLRARRVSLLVAGLLLLGSAVLYAYLAFYQEPRLEALQGKLLSARRTADGGIPQDAAAIYKNGVADLASFRSRMPLKKDFARFIGDILEMARADSLSMAGITYKPVVLQEERLLAYTVSFNVAGKYAKVKSFIADMANMPSIVVIDAISLNNSKLTEEYVDLKLQLTAYFRLEGQ